MVVYWVVRSDLNQVTRVQVIRHFVLSPSLDSDRNAELRQATPREPTLWDKPWAIELVTPS